MTDTGEGAQPRGASPFTAVRSVGGLRGRLLVVMSVVAFVVASAAAVLYALIVQAEAQALAIYEERVVPASALRSVSDSYAIEVVDTVHKVCARRLDIHEGARRVQHALVTGDAGWHTYVSRVSGAAALPDMESLFSRARAAAMQAQTLMRANDLEALDDFRVRRMYDLVEPLTQRLAQQVQQEIKHTDLLVSDTRARLRSVRIGASMALIAVALIGWTYVARFSRGLSRSFASMASVLRHVAEGDLSVRARGKVDAAFADMAADIDSMIHALERSRLALEAHSAELERVAEQARSANAAKSSFLSSMSHELRTPLNVILGYAQVLCREPERSASDRQAFDRIMQAGSHLLGLIEDVLSINKIEAGELTLRPERFETQALVVTLQDMFADRAAHKALALRIEADPNMPAWLHADVRRLRQVLVNLIGNALKFTERGEVRVQLCHREDRLYASVSDTGPGMEKDERARLFQRFFQGAAGQVATEGTGLGLYISRALVRAMGGELSVDSTLGVGSEFRFDIRAEPSAPDAKETRVARAMRLPPGTVCEPMLVADDREDNREVLGRLLRQLGFEVEEACDGRAAVEACSRRGYAIVWMDLRMPRVNGEEAMRQIREVDAALQRVPRKIVAITASVIEIDRATALRLGFDAFVSKPFSDLDVTTTISTLLGVRFVEHVLSAEESASIVAGDSRRAGASLRGLSELPRELCDTLLSALVAGDAALAHESLARVEPTELSRALRDSIDSYAYDAVIAELRAILSGSPSQAYQATAGDNA